MITTPQSNGQAERIDRVLVPMLSKLVNKEEDQSWHKILPQIEHALNNTLSKSTSETPSRLLVGIDQHNSVDDLVKEYLNTNVNVGDRDLIDIRAKFSEKIVLSKI